jgi:universal stress protein A
MNNIQNILVPIDFSETSKRALLFASDLAQQYNAKLTLLFVYQAPNTFFPEGYEPSVSMLFEDLYQYYEKSLASVAQSIEGQISSTPNMKLSQGVPDIEIIREATEGNYDLIVMGSHGRTGLSRVVIGSVAEKVVRHALCPTLIVPHKK